MWTRALLLNLLVSSAALAQSTAFTYQGELKDGFTPAGGQHDFRFRLLDAASGGTQLGTTQCVDNIQVNDGVFTATIDFGNQFASPNQRFIEIDVRRDTGLNCSNTTGYTTLTPRQPITPAPIATQAVSAFSLAAPDGSPAKAVFVANDGKVGIGTLVPTHWLHVAAAGPTIALQDTNAASQQTGYVSYRDNANIERAWVGYGSPGDPDFSIINARPSGDIVLNTFGGGNVGIGTASPAAKLEVRGDVRLGSSGQLFAAAGDQNLRILRGGISTTGAPFFGTGWASSRISAGWYSVHYNTGFGDAPTVVAMAATSGNVFVTLVNDNGSGFDLQVRNASGTLVDAPLRFIAVGVR